jgi:dTDP-4-amino-4,6-dideoxygalactose transaminase
VNRDECKVFAYNSRLDTIQAVVARHLLAKIDHITQSRISNAYHFDQGLRGLNQIQIPQRDPRIKEVFHLYSILCDDRDRLQRYLIERNVDAKVHYPTPMHLQPAATFLGHKPGDFLGAEMISRKTLSLPVHEFVTRTEQDYVIGLIRDFYGTAN